MSDQKNDVEIKRLAESIVDKLSEFCDESCCPSPYDKVVQAVSELTPPQEPVDREALGKLLCECFEDTPLEYVVKFEHFPKADQQGFIKAATQFALSIQKKEGVCVWTEQIKGGIWLKPSCNPQKSIHLLDDMKFCPFCSNKIQEQGGGE
jgi:hypothetical protein